MIDEHTVGECKTINSFLDAIEALCHIHNVTGIAVTLSIQNGECITTHQYGMDETQLRISSELLSEFAKGSTSNFTEQ